jgi:hypothetical protein
MIESSEFVRFSVMKAYGVVEVQLHSFISALDRGGQLRSPSRAV